ncbi:Hypothetical predicted protein, partial [Pelobates cultripes]
LLNVRGLNIPERRRLLLADMRRKGAGIVLLQETHFKRGGAPSLHDCRYSVGFFGNYVGGK